MTFDWRADDILLPGEAARRGEFIALCEEQATRLSAGGEATVADYVVARAVASALWRFDREVGDSAALRAALAEPQVMAERSTFRIADHRAGLQGLHVRAIELAHEAHAALRGEQAKKGKVFQFGAKK